MIPMHEKKLNRLIHESVKKNLLLMNLKNNSKKLVQEGKSREFINEFALGGLTAPGFKVGATAGTTGSSEGELSNDPFTEAKMLIIESIIEKIQEIFRINPNSLLGVAITQSLTTCLLKIDFDDIKSFLRTRDCDANAKAFASCVIEGLKKGIATKIVGEVVEFITGEDIKDIKKGFGGQFYRSMNNKITTGINKSLSDPALLDMAADKICSIDIYSIMTDEILPYASDMFYDALGNIGSTLKSLVPGV